MPDKEKPNSSIKDDIELVDSVMNKGNIWSHKRQAWYRLKEIIEKQLVSVE